MLAGCADHDNTTTQGQVPERDIFSFPIFARQAEAGLIVQQTHVSDSGIYVLI
jgi:hypothetical protein